MDRPAAGDSLAEHGEPARTYNRKDGYARQSERGRSESAGEMPPIFSAGEKNESLSAPAVKAAELGGVFVGADSFSTVQFHTVDAAEKFVAWLNRRFYQARAIIPPNEQCKLFSVSYR